MKWTLLWSCLGLLSFLYAVIVGSLGSGTRFHLFWAGVGLFFLFFAYAAYMHLWSRLPLPLKALFMTGLVFSVCLFGWVEIRILSCFNETLEQEPDYLIVLGAQVHEDGPSVVLRYRLERAAKYLEEHENTVCIVSGGQGYNEPWSEAEGMKRYLLSKGIKKERILTEDRSSSTRENLAFCKQFLDPAHDHAALVTNNFHMFRSLALARKAGYAHVSALPAGSSALFLPTNMVREFLAVLAQVRHV